jgi:hypothetical protein
MNDSTKPEMTPFEKMCDVTQRILAVPKKELDRRQAEWKRVRAEKKRRK